jgi:signal transduction histidine kinase
MSSMSTETKLVYRILHIEDDEPTSILVRIELEAQPDMACVISHHVRLKEGIEAGRKGEPFDVVLLDLSLPDSFGLETVLTLLRELPAIPVIVMTGNEDRNIGLASVQAGAQDFLNKGSLKDLPKAIRYSVERQAVLSRLSETQQLARIGHFEYHLTTGKIIVSDEVWTLLSVTNLEGLQPLIAKLVSVQEQLYDGKTHRFECNCEAGGVLAYFDMHARLGKEKTIQGFVQDISERIRSQELQKANVLAVESAKMREKFIANVSHEMRTPLNAINGMSHLLLGTTLNTEQQQYVDGVRQSSQLLLGIINDLLDVSAMQYGDIKIEQGQINLRDLLANLIGAMQFKNKEKQIILHYTCDDRVPLMVVGDALRVNQILYNLTGNAIKFTDQGSVEIALHLVKQAGETLVLRFDVKDTGWGIPADKLGGVFDTFSRVETKGRLVEGTGLGLSIVKNLVGLMKGEISVTSQVGVGTTFSVELPFELQTTHSQSNQVAAPLLPTYDAARPLRILLVEDNKMNMLVARKTLERIFSQVVVVEAEHGGVAVESMQKESFDLVLMDLQMPVVDGYEAVRAIRTELGAPANTTPVIAMTANAFVSREREGLFELGFDDYLLKPFQPEELKNKVNQHALNGKTLENNNLNIVKN